MVAADGNRMATALDRWLRTVETQVCAYARARRPGGVIRPRARAPTQVNPNRGNRPLVWIRSDEPVNCAAFVTVLVKV